MRRPGRYARPLLERLGLIALGGALGAVLRVGCVTLGARWVAAGIPLAVLLVNVRGSFAAGVVMSLAVARPNGSENLRAFAMLGVLGAFTTFSAFSWENLELLRQGAFGRAGLHALLHVGLSVGAVIAGAWVAR